MSEHDSVIIPEPDVLVSNHGTIFLFHPKNPDAGRWMREHTGPESQWFGDALVVEHRYAGGFAEALANDGGFYVE